MKLNIQKNRTVIIFGALLFLALMGLIFIRTDYVAADQNFSALNQSDETSAQSQSNELGETPSVFPSLIRIISALVLVIGSIYGGLYLLKKSMGTKYAGAKKNGNLEILETIHIAPKKTVTLLRVAEKSVLVGTTDSGMSVLSQLTSEETAKILEAVETAPSPESFGNLFKSAMDKVKEVTRKKSNTVIQHT